MLNGGVHQVVLPDEHLHMQQQCVGCFFLFPKSQSNFTTQEAQGP